MFEWAKKPSRTGDNISRPMVEVVATQASALNSMAGFSDSMGSNNSKGNNFDQINDDKLRQMIASNKVVVFTKADCPFSINTRTLLESLSHDVTVYQLDKIPNGDAVYAELCRLTNRKALPAVFISHKYQGGFEELQALHASHRLAPMILE